MKTIKIRCGIKSQKHTTTSWESHSKRKIEIQTTNQPTDRLWRTWHSENDKPREEMEKQEEWKKKAESMHNIHSYLAPMRAYTGHRAFTKCTFIRHLAKAFWNVDAICDAAIHWHVRSTANCDNCVSLSRRWDGIYGIHPVCLWLWDTWQRAIA